MMSDISLNSFAYIAQTLEGQPMTGTIDAADLEDANKRLADLRLRVIRLDPAQRPVRAKPLSGADFAAFNQQLAHLASAGLPIEQGLRLIAEDLHHGGLAQSVREVSSELERGVSLSEAFKRHEKQFPPLYGTLIEAGVRAGNLPGVLLNLGRHLDLVARLRAALWKAVSYPLAVLGGLLLVLLFLSTYVLPRFDQIFKSWHIQLPAVTVAAFKIASIMPAILVVALVVLFGWPLLMLVLRAMHLDRAAADLALPLPLIAPVLRRNLVARWADALKLGVQAGMDLPTAVKLACNIVGSPALSRDGKKIIAQITSGKKLDELPGTLVVLPRTVLAIVQVSGERNDLPTSLETLALMYHQQAELRLNSVAAVLAPVCLLLVGALIGFVIVALFVPLISLIQGVSSPVHFHK